MTIIALKENSPKCFKFGNPKFHIFGITKYTAFIGQYNGSIKGMFL